MRATLLPIAITIFFSSFSYAQKGWELKKDDDEIQIYVKKVEGSSIHAFRGVTTLSASLGAIIAAITDVESFPKWMPSTTHTKVLKTEDGRASVYYLVADVPWPLKDRDGVYRFTFHEDPRKKMVKIAVKSLPDYLPEKEERLRIRKSEGFWLLELLPDGRVGVTYELFTEPGGNVPAWLVNTSAVNQPFKTLAALRERVNIERYRGISYQFSGVE